MGISVQDHEVTKVIGIVKSENLLGVTSPHEGHMIVFRTLLDSYFVYVRCAFLFFIVIKYVYVLHILLTNVILLCSLMFKLELLYADK